MEINSTLLYYSDVLTRASQTVRENYPENTFVAKSAVTVTYVNVTTGNRKSAGNTFQALIVAGLNKNAENMTFVHLLYRDLPWSEGAEAGIMSFDEANSIMLPGSGTEGIEQLSQLSNIQIPGQWLYRIDTEAVYPCTHPQLQPPYCDATTPRRANNSQRRPNKTPSSQQTPRPFFNQILSYHS
ncbi:unnamed protein product [Anisakis simplex]|uniref:NIDO domain-containing protein n=1 Tax=Anisakis simplex TaxID=6269 RepID=A0A0M3KJB3_ANISI|nr:unnamed protein product [Anisakis simplex]